MANEIERKQIIAHQFYRGVILDGRDTDRTDAPKR